MTTDTPRSDTQSSRTALTIAAIPFLLIGGCVAWGFIGDTSTSRDDITETSARTVCRASVEKQLKAPDSAEYSDESYQREGTGRWTGHGTVRAENSVGGTAVNRFTCDITKSADGITGVAHITR